jgi:hypothetical protein
MKKKSLETTVIVSKEHSRRGMTVPEQRSTCECAKEISTALQLARTPSTSKSDQYLSLASQVYKSSKHIESDECSTLATETELSHALTKLHSISSDGKQQVFKSFAQHNNGKSRNSLSSKRSFTTQRFRTLQATQQATWPTLDNSIRQRRQPFSTKLNSISAQ